MYYHKSHTCKEYRKKQGKQIHAKQGNTVVTLLDQLHAKWVVAYIFSKGESFLDNVKSNTAEEASEAPPRGRYYCSMYRSGLYTKSHALSRKKIEVEKAFEAAFER